MNSARKVIRKMKDKKIITIQDISCYGQCSLTVALPILSAAGYETAIIPSAVLSTHTAGFKGFTFHDLTSEISPILDHYKKEGIKFDALYSGYLGGKDQIELVKRMKNEVLNDGGIYAFDPAMADQGKLYPAFDNNYVNEMKELVKISDIILPNLTEACFLTGMEYKEHYDEEYVISVMKKLVKMGAKKVVLTGISYKEDKLGVAIYEDGYKYYEHERISKGCHGTGDVYASAFLGAYMKSNDLFKASKIAADYVVLCIKNTINDPSHWYGVKFEPMLKEYISMLK